MSTRLNFYSIPKNKVPQKQLEALVLDQCETSAAKDIGATFVDLVILEDAMDELDDTYIDWYTGLHPYGQARQVISAFMSDKGITGSIYNTSMVMSKQLVTELLDYVITSPLWGVDNDFYLYHEKEGTELFFQHVVNKHDFDAAYFFYVYGR